MMIRPQIKNALIHKKFFKDLGKDEKKVDRIVKMILDCSNLEFYELHKFEKNIAGNLLFRAKRKGIHFVYSINKNDTENLIFLRAMTNFTEYKRLLANEEQIKRMIEKV
jgi:hypothetical protein